MVIQVPASLRLLRPNEWVKNVFVFAGVVFGAQLQNWRLDRSAFLTVIAFSLMSSSAYVLNDYWDREADRTHPTKRLRPLASGAMSVIRAFSLGLICVVCSLMTAWYADPRVLLVVLAYLAINIAYSVRLKNYAVLDVFCIASGFMLRIFAGTWGIGIPPSGWLILTGMFLTLFLGFAKRRAEWIDAIGPNKRRQVLNHYTQPLLDGFLSITATGTALSYGLYSLEARTIFLHHTDKLIYTMPLVLFGLFRYLLLLHSRNKGENPSIDVFSDVQIICCVLAFAASILWLSYG